MLPFMESGRWEQMERIFEAAVAQPEEQRAAFIKDACEGDLELQEKIQASSVIRKPLRTA